MNQRFFHRHRQVAEAIDAGHRSQDEIATHLGIPKAAVAASIHYLRYEVCGITILAGRTAGRTRYTLASPLASIRVALAVEPPQFDAGSLCEAFPIPSEIRATLAIQTPARTIEHMGRWDEPRGRPKSAGRLSA